MSYVVIDMQQKVTDAKAIRDYLLEAEQALPKTVLNIAVHSWLHQVASKIDDQAKRRTVPVRTK